MGKEILFDKYQDKFEILKPGTRKVLKDKESEKGSSLPVEVCGENVYLSEPDGKLIPNVHKQHKCDFLLYSASARQTCFVELKGANISKKSGYNPYDQIIDTIRFFQKESVLKTLVDGKTEKHAFIVSPGRQKIPKGIETKERQLWQFLVQDGRKSKIYDVLHYVKVTKSDRYSNHDQIICSPQSPVKYRLRVKYV